MASGFGRRLRRVLRRRFESSSLASSDSVEYVE